METNDIKYYENFKIWFKCEYPCIYIDGKDIYLHVYIWEKKYGNKPKGYEVHHIDFNKNNYDIKNLILVTLSDHRRYHAGWIKENNIWIKKPCNNCKKILPLSNFYYVKTRKIQSALCKKCHNDIIIKRNHMPENREKKLQYYRDYHKKNANK